MLNVLSLFGLTGPTENPNTLFYIIGIPAGIGGLILLDRRENTFCVPFERAASILAGTAAAYVLAIFYGAPYPTRMEVIGMVLLIVAIALLSLAPRWEASRSASVFRGATTKNA